MSRRKLMLAALAASLSPLVRSQPGEAGRGSPPPKPLARQGQVTVKGVPVHYEVRGEGRPIIMIHGFVVDSHSLMGAMEPVFAHRSGAHRSGWRRIYFDMPGMGRTPASDTVTSSDEMLELILAFIDAVIPGERFALVGQSYGGYLARGVLARKADSIDGMALIVPVAVAERAKRDLPPRTVVSKDDKWLATLSRTDAEAFTPNFVVQTEPVWKRFREELLPGIREANQPALEKISQHYGLSFDVDDLKTPFTKPVLIVTGHQDSDVGYRDQWKLLQNYPRGSFAVLDGAGHGLAIEQAGLFEAMAAQWLDRLGSASGGKA
nr:MULTISPECIES: alpha/beta hydrolase [unclassified Dyella]